MTEANIKKYHKAVCEAYANRNIESSYTPALLALLESFGIKARDMSGERGQAKGGNIDIKLWRADEEPGGTNPFGGVEVKKIGGIDGRAEEQAKLSARLFGNVILTDNCTWRFYRAGDEDLYTGIRIIDAEGKNPNAALQLKKENIELFVSLVQDFCLQDPALIRSSNKLAEYMAIHARTIRSVILGVLKNDGAGQPLVDARQQGLPMFSDLYALFCRLKSELRPHLDSRGFADMYAQTIVYGLFVARYNDTASAKFDRLRALMRLQEESQLLNRFFNHITTSGKTHPTLDGVIGKLCRLYETCDLSALLDGDEAGDTIVHFYENFLAYYDPDLRKALGVFYTPQPVVEYLVHMVDKSLVEDFNVDGGLSNSDYAEIEVKSEEYQETAKKTSTSRKVKAPCVAVLDPACGTGAFHAEIIKFVKKKYFGGAKEMFFKDYIEGGGLLERLAGFEIMMTSYVVAHLNVRRAVAEALGAAPSAHLPSKIFLTNTLAKAAAALERGQQMSLNDFTSAISDEAYNADTWKARRPIKAIIGNPPYLAASTTPYEDVRAYFTEADGNEKLKERSSRSLLDDYVKFFRFAEQIIQRNNEGILAFVSNNGYLDNPTFRGMRASLLRTFDKIYIVDLHGSAMKKETAPDGGKDENIFDIMQGVSLFVGIKTTASKDWAKVYHADLWGARAEKFCKLSSRKVDFVEVLPEAKLAYFIPYEKNNEYENGIALTELYPSYTIGVETQRDAMCVKKTRKEVEQTVFDMLHYGAESIREMYKDSYDGSGWSLQNAIDDVMQQSGKVATLSYRPFDDRWTYYSSKSNGFLGRPRYNVMQHLFAASDTPIGKNIGLCFVRSDKSQEKWAMIFVTDTITERCYLTTQTSGGAYVAPLYLNAPNDIDGSEWTPNLSPEALSRLSANLPAAPGPVEIFDYCYGVLNDPSYVGKYSEYLKRDYPRVKIPANGREFEKYVQAGRRLRRLHLMQEKIPAELTVEPATNEDLVIGSIKYKDGALHINPKKQIRGIPQDVWQYRIGGYQVLDKWFKSRKGETLTLKRLEHVMDMAGLLAETVKIREGLRALGQ